MTGGGAMTIDLGLQYRPSYRRRAPRWYDGVARLMDLGGTFDLKLPAESDAERLAEDRFMIQQDMRVAVDQLREELRALHD